MTAAAHEPVLLDAVVNAATPVIQKFWVDATVGLGGHARAIFAAASADATLIALDVDPANLEAARRNLADFAPRARFFRANFRNLDAVLDDAGIPQVDFLLADLGVSSNQIDNPQIGLSFEADGPLDMRLDRDLPHTAADLVNTMKEADLANLLYVEAQEHYSRRIARRICQARIESRINTTGQLARLVAGAIGGRRGRLHPATRTFMALRIAVNQENQALEALLESGPRRLRQGGRMAVVSFHSGEDRRVKQAFKAGEQAGLLRVLTKRPIVADEAEARANPRSRSAKLRIAERRGS